jgi:RNA polymerase sigma factor (sigma-70 family)
VKKVHDFGNGLHGTTYSIMTEPFSAEEFLRAYHKDDRQLRAYLHIMETQWKPYITGVIRDTGGDTADVEDVFQESIYELVANLGTGAFQGKSSLRTYFTQICKFKWSARMRKEKRRGEIRDEIFGGDEPSAEMDVMVSYQDLKEILGDLLDGLGAMCKEILTLWALGHTYEEILTLTGITSSGTARKRKFDCVEKLQSLINARPALRAQLLDYLKVFFQ